MRNEGKVRKDGKEKDGVRTEVKMYIEIAGTKKN